MKDDERSGPIVSVDGMSATTENGVRLELDWSSMQLSQSGRDTRFINKLYDIHYLRWTGVEMLDRVLAVAGLALLVALALLGLRLAFAPAPRTEVSE